MLKNINLKVVTLMILTATPLCSNPMGIAGKLFSLVKGGSIATLITASSIGGSELADMYFRKQSKYNMGSVANIGTQFLLVPFLVNSFRATTAVRQNGISLVGLKNSMPKSFSAFGSCLKTFALPQGLPRPVKYAVGAGMFLGTVKTGAKMAGYDYQTFVALKYINSKLGKEQGLKS